MGETERRPLERAGDRHGVVEALYALVYGLVELGATLPAEEYHAALASAKGLIRGTLLAAEQRA
jgi:hypothetical protein